VTVVVVDILFSCALETHSLKPICLLIAYVGDQPRSSCSSILPSPSPASLAPAEVDTLSAVFQPINPLAASSAALTAISKASPGKVRVRTSLQP